jgi:hypothetical protein
VFDSVITLPTNRHTSQHPHRAADALGPCPPRSVAFMGRRQGNQLCLPLFLVAAAGLPKTRRPDPTTRGGPTRFRRAEAPLPSTPTAEPPAVAGGSESEHTSRRSKFPSVTVTGAFGVGGRTRQGGIKSCHGRHRGLLETFWSLVLIVWGFSCRSLEFE